VARFPSDGGAGFLIGGFAQKKFEHQSKNTVFGSPKRTYDVTKSAGRIAKATFA